MSRANPIAIKASESVLAKTLSRWLGAPAGETIQEVVDAFCDQELADSRLANLLREGAELYPWVVDVPVAFRGVATTPLSEFLMSLPGAAYFVKDGGSSGVDALWLAIADPPARFMTALQEIGCRGLFKTHKVDEEHVFLIAIQITSCQ